MVFGAMRRLVNGYGVDPALVKAIMRCESSFTMTRKGKILTSSAGALGLMQVMPPTGAQLARARGGDPAQFAELPDR